MTPIQMLWIGERLSTLERLSITSFLANGHEVHLYTYTPVEGVPAGTRLKDAAAIVPASRIFGYRDGPGKGSPAGFANEFRYKLLLDIGGAWSDTDTVCLKPFTFLDEMPYAVSSERVQPRAGVASPGHKPNCGLMKAPAGSAFMAACHATAAAADRDALRWGQTGPELVGRMLAQHGLQRYALPPEAICPIDWWHMRAILTAPVPESPGVFGIHLWNAIWRHAGLDKDARYPPDGAYEVLKRRYLVAGDT